MEQQPLLTSGRPCAGHGAAHPMLADSPSR